MEEILNSIVIHRKTPEECVNRELLERYTNKIQGPFVKKVRWSKIKHLYILGTASSAESLPKDDALQPGAYEDTFRRWVLIVGAEDTEVQKYLSRCSAELEKLVVRFTNLEKLDVKRLTGLKSLMLERNHALKQVSGLEQLKELRKLHLTRTAVRNIQLSEPLPNVSDFYGNGTLLEDADFVRMLPGLSVLNLSKSPLVKMPPVSDLPRLKVLKLSDTALTTIDGEEFPEGLASISLDGTPLRRLPDSIGKLRNLKVLDLSRMTLDYLPGWLPELNLEFTLEKTGSAIRLNETRVDDVDMSIFAQPNEIILEWFRETETGKLGTVQNGVKVALMGNDGDDLLLLTRLLNDGKGSLLDCLENNRYVVNKIFSAYGQKIRAQFWCLYAPEVLRKVQPVFLADRTLYLIAVNAQEKNPQKKAERWLREVGSYAPNAPVMLVVNGTGDVDNTNFDIEQLRSIHENIRSVVTVSLLQDSAEQFRWKFKQPLLEQLLSFPKLMLEVPKPWGELARQLEQSRSPYLPLTQYERLCGQCGIADENVRMNLLQWFTDIGICFYSDAADVLSNGILLQPDWFIQAVYFLQESGPKSIHRSVCGSSQLIHSLCAPFFKNAKTESSPENGWHGCDAVEAMYILELMRRCSLSIPINDQQELIPLRCHRKTAEVFYQYSAAQDACSVKIKYKYLPVEVIHRLILRLRKNLDLKNIWYYGARFQDEAAAESVVLQKEEDTLQIYARGNADNQLLKRIESAIEEINEEIRLVSDSQTSQKRKQEMEELLRQQLGERDKTEDQSLNEIRVIFLGDGEAGKSQIINRLLKLRIEDDGEKTELPAFTGDATPGIMMSHGKYELVGGRKVRLNFWDFGGQEILHSMHRIFVTDQTMCVIVLNARSDTQDDRARYWLRYIKSVSADMPVLLVLNKIDQNINASINENELRRIYPDAAPIIRMSALKDEDQTIRDSLLHALLGKIGLMGALQTQMPSNWRKVKEALQSSGEPYIRKEDYETLCRQNGIPEEDEMYSKLLNWFNIMGVSYRCDVPGRIGTYTILRPEWVTNAAYAILFNSYTDVKNGIVSRRSLDDLLRNTRNIQCVDHERGYSSDEVDYVIQIMRQNKLSYCISSPDAVEHSEFIPMLCQRNESAAVSEYADDPNTIEFWIRFDYLPDTLMFYLMVDNFPALDQEHIWLTGARFTDKDNGASAIVKRDENVLKLYVRSDRFYPTAAQYRDTLRGMVHSAVDKHLPGLRIIEELVVVRDNGDFETFDYQRMSVNQQNGITHCFSKRSGAQLAISDILEQRNSTEQERKDQLLDELIKTCRKMQEVPQPKEEDLRNKKIMHITSGRPIQGKKLEVLDQSQGGKGKTGVRLGERDLMFCIEPDSPWVILEALNITGSGTKDMNNWRYHLDKLMENYNPYGLRTLILLSYVNSKREGFTRVWKRYFQEAGQYSPEAHPLIEGTVREIIPKNNPQTNYLKLSRGCYGHEDAQMEVYHLFVWLDMAEDKETSA